jgi:ribosomal protein S27AE
MEYRYDTYCGLYCGACPVLVANQKGTIEELASRNDMDPADFVCAGCKSDTLASFCADCRFIPCAREKGVEFCVDCDEYPCENLTGFRDDERAHHSVVTKNLDRLKEVGLEAWLAEQDERWKCGACGARFAWYDEECPECGIGTYDARAEEKDIK